VIQGALACEEGRICRGVARATGSVAIVALFAAVASVAAEVGWRFPTDMMTLQQWLTLREDVLAKPKRMGHFAGSEAEFVSW